VLSLDTGDIGELVRKIAASDDWQLLIEQRASKDLLSLKWVPCTQTADISQASSTLRRALIDQYPLIEKLQSDQLLELNVTACANDELTCHPRSGKHQRVVDRRVYDHPQQGQA